MDAVAQRKKIDRVRVFALGVRRKYQHTGVAARFYQMHFDSAERTPQSGGEMGWILETNDAMNRAMEGMGGTIVRRYRLFERRMETGIGPALARRIVSDRDSAGSFGCLAALDAVKGIGPSMLRRLDSLTSFSGAPRAACVRDAAERPGS